MQFISYISDEFVALDEFVYVFVLVLVKRLVGGRKGGRGGMNQSERVESEPLSCRLAVQSACALRVLWEASPTPLLV